MGLGGIICLRVKNKGWGVKGLGDGIINLFMGVKNVTLLGDNSGHFSFSQ